MKKLITIVAILLAGFGSLQAQMPAPQVYSAPGNGIVRGKVRDASEQQMMEYASVVLFRASDSAMVDGCVTGPDGSFELKNIPNGNYYLTIQFVGYSRKKIENIQCSKDKNTIDLGVIEMQGTANSIEGAEITSEVKTVEYSIDKKIINVGKDIVASSGTALDVLRNVPSVQVDAEGNVTVRGSSNFTLLVNGRPVPQEAVDVLRQTPASTVENIEIITNPSAKYDPDGTAGIINLILKKNRRDGMNGIVNASYGTFNKYSTDAQLSVKTGAFNIFGGAEYSNRRQQVTQNIEKTWFSNDTAFNTFAIVDQEYHPWHYKFNLGSDWNIDDNNALSLSGSWFRQDFNVASPVGYHIFSDPMSTESWQYYENNLLLKHHWGEGNLNYTHQFKKPGHTLMVNMLYNAWKGDKSDQQQKNITDADWNNVIATEARRRRFYDNHSSRISGDIDYVLPINDKMKMEAGYSGDITTFQSEYMVDNFDPDMNSWINDTSMSNGFNFNYQVHALYGTLSGELWGLGYQLGLRGEYFQRSLATQVPDTNYAMEIWSLFPSFHVSKSFKKGHQLMFSYSRRVNRPTVMALNPLPYFNDEYLIHSGNPALRPEYANSFELGYQKTFKESFLSVESYYRSTQDKMVETITISEGQTRLTNDNIASDWAVGMEVMLNLSIKKFFRLNAKVDGFTYHLIGNEASGVPSRSAYSATASLSPSFIFKTGTTAQIQAMYFAPGIDAIGEMEGFSMLNIAVKQDFLKKKLSVTLSANNLFNLTKYSYTDETTQYRHHFDYIPEANTFNISLSYKINNYSRGASARQGNGAMDVGF